MFMSSEIVIVFLGFIAMTLSIPTGLHKRNSEDEVQVLKYHDDRNVDGSYDFKWDKNSKLIVEKLNKFMQFLTSFFGN